VTETASPEQTDGLVVTAVPQTTVSPTTAPGVAATLQPVVTTKPGAAAEPGTTVKPVVTTKPGATRKPVVTAKPSATARPTAVPTPKASAESAQNRVTVSKVKGVRVYSAKKKLVIRWSELENADGYQVQYSTRKSFAGSRTLTVKGSKTACTIKKLTSRKIYYVRIRAYRSREDEFGDVSRVYGKYTTLKRLVR
jgi:hypothetical protein